MRERYVAGGILLILAAGAGAIELLTHTADPIRLSAIASLGFATPAVALLIYADRLPNNVNRREALSTAVAFLACLAIVIFAVLEGGTMPSGGWLMLGVAAAWTLIWLPKGMRQLTVTTRFTFSSDPSSVFGYLSDFRTQMQYAPDIQSVEKLTEGPIGVGTKFRTKGMLKRGASFTVEEAMTLFERDQRYASQIEGDQMTGTATFDALPHGTAGTFQVTTTLRYASALYGVCLLRPLLAKQLRDRRRAAWSRVDEILRSGTARTYD